MCVCDLQLDTSAPYWLLLSSPERSVCCGAQSGTRGYAGVGTNLIQKTRAQWNSICDFVSITDNWVSIVFLTYQI